MAPPTITAGKVAAGRSSSADSRNVCVPPPLSPVTPSRDVHRIVRQAREKIERADRVPHLQAHRVSAGAVRFRVWWQLFISDRAAVRIADHVVNMNTTSAQLREPAARSLMRIARAFVACLSPPAATFSQRVGFRTFVRAAVRAERPTATPSRANVHAATARPAACPPCASSRCFRSRFAPVWPIQIPADVMLPGALAKNTFSMVAVAHDLAVNHRSQRHLLRHRPQPERDLSCCRNASGAQLPTDQRK